MKLKKIASVIAAVAMAATLCMPAFADATPGEIANNAAEQAAASQDIAEIASYVAQATESLKLSSEPVTVSVPVTSQAIRYFDMAEEKGWVNPVASGDIIYRCDNGATVNASCNVADDYTITIDATASGDSAHGYALSVKLPLDCNVQTYTLSETSGQVSFTATADVINVGGEFKMVTFWVPHFTTYVLTPASVSGGNSSSGGDDNNNSNNSSNSSNNSSNNSQAVTTQTTTSTVTTTETVTAPAVEENPIKKTGASMDMTMFVVVALAAAAVCGMGVAVKKAHKGE